MCISGMWDTMSVFARRSGILFVIFRRSVAQHSSEITVPSPVLVQDSSGLWAFKGLSWSSSETVATKVSKIRKTPTENSFVTRSFAHEMSRLTPYVVLLDPQREVGGTLNGGDEMYASVHYFCSATLGGIITS